MEAFVMKLLNALDNVWGWMMALILGAIDFIAGYGVMVVIAVMSVVIDAVWGIASARKQGRFALSELARNTLSKLSVYGCCMIFFIFIDSILGSESGLTTGIVCVCIVLVELWSTCASMIICFPKLPFLVILKKALAGEIGRKLGVEPDKVEAALSVINKTEGGTSGTEAKEDEEH